MKVSFLPSGHGAVHAGVDVPGEAVARVALAGDLARRRVERADPGNIGQCKTSLINTQENNMLIKVV